jgi:DNA-binding YbaB/EbfC family protein
LAIVDCRLDAQSRLSNLQSSIGNLQFALRERMNIQKMMQQAQAMQTQMQQELAAMRIEAASGGGMVRIEMSGTKEVLAVHIDKTAVDPEDVETLQDLVLAAAREASRRVDEAVQKKTASMLGGMMPGLR